MIPKILHQTWKTDIVPPRFQGYVDSWKRHHPDWTMMFWNDRTLLEFVAAHYPSFLPTFCSYEYGILRADAGRYLLLHHFGGVYADIDCECVAPFDPILGEDRIVFCTEPDAHARVQADFRGLPYLLFNGTMASPPGHPFWLHLLSFLPGLVRAKQAIDATGPCVLTSAQLGYPDQTAFAIHPAELYSPLDSSGKRAGSGGMTLSIHHWAGTWWTPEKPARLRHRLRKLIYQARHRLTRGTISDEQAARQSVSQAAVAARPPSGSNLAVLVPLRDAAQHIEPFLAALRQLDYPKNRMKLVFCEGDSSDDSWERLQGATAALGKDYREVVLLRKQLGTELDRDKRANRQLQRVRRSGIAKVRNHLIDKGLTEEDDWALWIDIDVWCFPADVVTRLIARGHRIVAPHCVKVPGGDSFDLNSFVTVRHNRDHNYFRHVHDGLYQPPRHTHARLHMSDVRHLDSIGLDGVGGTMLLVDAALHRGGLRFPEIPYRDLIETEGFGALANDLGIRPIGLPRLEIQHVPW
ncbi:MAG: glycosyl transferase [Mesorhizobium sp.]|uniref:glycosyltransferase n=1 Tax=unclassified Mesorhizobium TaxID=325217 RepID=UPI000F75BA42|nr:MULTISPECIES: glycosyltransferase [unclassified Mesorhizobium]TGV94843.1 glycosyl transferase [Mesorhizobium sp. M00.F.Ca.ET.158.01.1.1]AZO60066.1 glycosyl transferase [Mesorhizobium sp. M1A.F.Ca.IN.022.06.1.1]MCT2576430.1 glycosyl transferase [Mesorhizobium sp. P13.3]MDF3164638.1 glycosyltransferase [Mesorhizobium sp. P16.1]MDF3180155.1 glycosyltransferase [Mesorhizobium sp. P17.1]